MTDGKAEKIKDILTARHLLLKTIRDYLTKEGLIEVQVPVSSFHAIPEASIELFTFDTKGGQKYLLPSPEIHLKPLLSLDLNGFFYIGPAFRKNEAGEKHLSEFTILEWYRTNKNYEVLIKDCQNIVCNTFNCLKNSTEFYSLKVSQMDLSLPFEVLTIEEAFLKFSDWNPITIKNEIKFDEDMAFKIEPNLPKDRPIFLKDYPSWACSLAKLKENNKAICERVELYLKGIELANGFSELLDAKEQKKRFIIENKKRIKRGLPPIEIPISFLKQLDKCPPSAGMALGIDRLLMALLDLENIKETQATLSF